MSKAKHLVLFLLVFLLFGCALPGVVVGPTQSIGGSGKPVTREFTLDNFDQVQVSNAFKADIRQGNSYSVVITVDDNLEQYLQVDKQGDRLRIGLKPGVSIPRGRLEAKVTMPELVGVDGSGAASVTISGFESGRALNAQVSGASSLRGDIMAGDLTADVSGASTLVLEGSGDNGNLDASGASTIDLSSFPLKDANVMASGASRVTVDARGRLNADASGASTIEYLDNPELGNIKTSGASNVRQR